MTEICVYFKFRSDFQPTTSAPNGISASFAILKHCLPTGMPRIVTPPNQPEHRIANRHLPTEKQNPDEIDQKRKPAAAINDLFPKREKSQLLPS